MTESRYADDETIGELERLRSENAALKEKLEELTKDGEAVGYLVTTLDDLTMLTKTKVELVGHTCNPLYLHPLNVAEIERRTAEACAKCIDDEGYGTNAIRSGKWREYLC